MPPQHYRTAVPLGLLLAAMLLTGLTACTPPHRVARDGSTLVPLNGPGGGLPVNGTLPKGDNGPIYFDSLYVRTLIDPHGGGPMVHYERFWPTGQILARAKPNAVLTGNATLQRLVTASDGDIVDDWLAGPPDPHGVRPGVVGYYCLVGNDIYIEGFGFTPDGLAYCLYAGKLTADGFVINRYNPEVGPFRFWKTMPEQRFVRCQVGKMRGEPTW